MEDNAPNFAQITIFFGILKWENIQKISTNSIMNIEVQDKLALIDC